MAREKRFVWEITDDYTGEQVPEDEARVVRLSYNGKHYELDLSEESATKLDEVIAPFLARTKPQVTSRFPRSGIEKRQRNETKAIREWARENGMQVSARGVISQQVRDAYNERR